MWITSSDAMSDYQNGAVGMHSAVSLATNLHDLKVEDTTIQAILQHSNVAVTWKCYIKTRPDNLWRQSSSSKQQCALPVRKKLIN